MPSIRSALPWSALLAVTLFSVSAPAAEQGHFHHMHMNVADVARTTKFYQQNLGVASVQYNNRTPALMMERSFLFLNRMDADKIANHQMTGLTHGCWGTDEGAHTFQWLKGKGVEFYTPVEELTPGSTYMYLYGPDREVVEITDANPHHRFNHVHLVAKDDSAAKQTAEWFRALIAFDKPVVSGPMRNENLSIDGVLFAFFPIGARFTPRENDGTLRNTDGTQLDHVAFSFRDLPAAYQRIRKQGVEIVRPMTRDEEYGFRHFFVRAPNGVLVELLEARPWPDAAWER
jgi:catechol 2,3-dioxygenase-like lactoylglutathione lyase family enzyme